MVIDIFTIALLPFYTKFKHLFPEESSPNFIIYGSLFVESRLIVCVN